jgi:ligand-binding SRPBCC domain-containing protein
MSIAVYTLERRQEIARSRSDVFRFFSDPFNLERITPRFLRFRILSPRPIVLTAGTHLEYSLALFGVRFRWKTLIEQWLPEESFVDVQLSGPYKLWRHTHIFTKLGDDRTLMIDRVEYALPGGAFAKPAHAFFVSPILKRIFDYRGRMIERMLAPGDVSAKSPAQ